MLPQYWRLYLLTLVLGVGGSFQYGIHISVITFPAKVAWKNRPLNCVTQIGWGHVTSDLSAAHSKICEPHVDAEVRSGAVWFQQPAHLVLHPGCVEPGRLGRHHSRRQTSCCLWTVRQHTHTHTFLDKLLINSNYSTIRFILICTKSVFLNSLTWVFLFCFVSFF